MRDVMQPSLDDLRAELAQLRLFLEVELSGLANPSSSEGFEVLGPDLCQGCAKEVAQARAPSRFEHGRTLTLRSGRGTVVIEMSANVAGQTATG